MLPAKTQKIPGWKMIHFLQKNSPFWGDMLIFRGWDNMREEVDIFFFFLSHFVFLNLSEAKTNFCTFSWCSCSCGKPWNKTWQHLNSFFKSPFGGEQAEQIHKKQRQPNNSETFYFITWFLPRGRPAWYGRGWPIVYTLWWLQRERPTDGELQGRCDLKIDLFCMIRLT